MTIKNPNVPCFIPKICGYCERLMEDYYKYGRESFYAFYVAENLTHKEACDLRLKMIKENETYNPDIGYNVIKKWREELKGKHRKRGPMSEEQKEKMSVAQRRSYDESSVRREKLRAALYRRMTEDREYQSRCGKASGEKRAVPVVDEEGNEYASILECAKINNVHPALVQKSLHGPYTVKGKRYTLHKSAVEKLVLSPAKKLLETPNDYSEEEVDGKHSTVETERLRWFQLREGND